MVGAAGFEPTTSCSQSRRATGLRYAPNGRRKVTPGYLRHPPRDVDMPTDISAFARPLRIVWAAVCAGGALVMGTLGMLAASAESAPLAEVAQGAFFGVALASMAATAGAFALVRTMETRLERAGSDAEAEGVARTFGVASLAVAEVPAILGAVAAFLTGDLLALAFGLTLFAFAWLTWPSDDRVAGWLAMRHRR